MDDRVVFLVQRIGGGEQKFLFCPVVEVIAAREADRPDRAHEAFLRAGSGQCRFQIGDVGGKCGGPDVFDRTGAGGARNGPPRGAPHEAATRFRVLIELCKFLPVAAIGEGGQREIGDARLLVPRLCARAGRRKSGQSRKGVVPPRAVVIAPGYRFAELTVIGNVDAKFALPAHHVGNGGGEDLRESGVVLAFSRGARPADGDETCRPRQASGVGSENAICTASHGPPRPFGNLRRMLERVPVIWKRRRWAKSPAAADDMPHYPPPTFRVPAAKSHNVGKSAQRSSPTNL